MKTTFMKYLIVALVLFIPGTLLAAGKSPVTQGTQYIDADKDGVNDMFRDADGDGVNDVNGKEYPHNFKFSDADGDGKNDLFRDSDGDGINDLTEGEQKGESANISNYVIDFNDDGVNDITGKSYSIENQGRPSFIDEDGDGINDNVSGRDIVPGKGQNRQYDKFTDEDGDGINDGRGFGREMRNNNPDKYGGRNRGGRND